MKVCEDRSDKGVDYKNMVPSQVYSCGVDNLNNCKYYIMKTLRGNVVFLKDGSEFDQASGMITRLRNITLLPNAKLTI